MAFTRKDGWLFPALNDDAVVVDEVVVEDKPKRVTKAKAKDEADAGSDAGTTAEVSEDLG